MKQKIKNLIQERDEAFVKHFCTMGTFLSDEGAIRSGVCRPISVTEVLNFFHEYDKQILEEIDSKENK